MKCEGGCGSDMLRPFMLDAEERALCETCSGLLCSLQCGRVTMPDDRLPYTNGGVEGYVHFDCVGKYQRALGWQLTSTLIARRGPSFRGGAS